MSKRVLFIAYYFPPLMHTATIRSLKFVKYLAEFGWDATVLTIDPRIRTQKWDVIDETLLEEVPDTCKIYTTNEFSPLGIARKWIKPFSRQELLGEHGDQTTVKINPTPKPIRQFSDFLKNWLLIPDQNIGWYPFAVANGLEIIKNEKIDAIFTTSGPYTTNLIGLRLKQRTELPWVADFRDNWTNWVNMQYPTPMHERIHKYLEKKVFLNADKITTVQPDLYDQSDSSLDSSKFVHLTNGFDEADFINLQRKPNSKFTITYTGSFYKTLNPEGFFQALHTLLAEKPAVRENLCVRILGRSYHVDIAKLAQTWGLSDIVRYEGFVPHQTALQAMVDADVLLLILFNTEHSANKTVYSGKFFEYLRASRPILGVVPLDGVAAEIIQNTDSGIAVAPDDVSGLKDAITAMYSKWEKKHLSVPSDRNLLPYSRYGLAQRLATILNNIST